RQRFGGDLVQHHHRVVRRLAPQRVIEPAEDIASGAPGPGQVVREIGKSREACGNLFSHVQAPTSCAKRVKSMLPPETTATARRWPSSGIRGEQAAAIAHAAAPSAMMWQRSAASFMARAASSSFTTSDSSTNWDTSAYIDGRTD